MKIDAGVETAVRKVFAGSVTEEPERFEGALAALTTRGEGFARGCLNLALAIDCCALFILHDHGRPDEEQLTCLTQSLLESETWAELDPDAAVRFPAALADETPVTDAVSLEDAAELAFVVG